MYVGRCSGKWRRLVFAEKRLGSKIHASDQKLLISKMINFLGPSSLSAPQKICYLFSKFHQKQARSKVDTRIQSLDNIL